LKSLKELGERKIIEIIIKHLEKMPNMPIPFGDDASAIDIGHRKLAVIKTDMLIGKTDVPKGMGLWQTARKAVVMNISDLAAKGTQPIAILVSLGLPQGYTEKDVEQISKGLNAGAREYNAYILGGDTSEASDLIISCSVLGIIERHLLMRRSGAKPSDVVAVTGYFGKTTAGLKFLLEGVPTPAGIKQALVDTVLMPKARLEEGLTLAQTRAVTASIDSSDGLAWSLHEIAKASNVGFFIDNLPIAKEAEEFAKIHNLDPIELSLYGGEEYELVITVAPKLWKRAKDAVQNVGTQLIKIGEVTKEKSLILKTRRKLIQIEPKGWEHFKMS
jgi:thiamine-monophosphate kinase